MTSVGSRPPEPFPADPAAAAGPQAHRRAAGARPRGAAAAGFKGLGSIFRGSIRKIGNNDVGVEARVLSLMCPDPELGWSRVPT